jgi:hypothetical protein
MRRPHWVVAWFVLVVAFLKAQGKADSWDWQYDGLPAGRVILREDSTGGLYVAACHESGVLLARRDGSTRFAEVFRGPISGLAVTHDRSVWYASGKARIFRRSASDDAVTERTAAFGAVRPAGFRSLFVSRSGELYASGAGRYRTPDAQFLPVTAEASGGAAIEIHSEDSFGNQWGLARQSSGQASVVTRNTINAASWTAVPGVAPQGWEQLLADDLGYVWLYGGQELVRIDPRHPDRGWKVFPTQDLPSAVTAVTRFPNRQLLAGFADGSVRELAWTAKGAIDVREVAGGERTGEPIRALHVDARGDVWAVTGGKIARRDAAQEAWQRHWREAARLPAGNHDIIFARDGEQFYTAGGKTFHGFPATEWINLDEIWRYDSGRGLWQVATPMLRPGKAYSGIATLHGEIWLIGGYLRAGQGTKAVADVEIYNQRTGLVRWGPPLDVARGQVVALTLGERLFAIGGASDERPLARMVSIGVGENAWREETPPPGAIEQASGCVLDGKLYIAAGQRNGCPGLFVYDPEAPQEKWSSVAHPTGKPPQAPLCAAFGGRVWVLGGTGAGVDGRGVYHYDPRSKAWERGPDLPLPVSWGAATEVHGELLIAGGAYRADDVGDYFNSDRTFVLRSSPGSRSGK